ncbi:MAG: pantetheine-phosphate adenylyltransferase [Oscillospiraceae bacterium]|nr:pantetheine-phosphate adenylyltransferase [Oscillospiraceae bacterium]
MRIAVYPGSFDPITNGHLDVIQRASHMFDRLVVAVLNNSSKSPVFSVEERVDLIRRSIPKIEGCEIVVDSFDGLLANYADLIGATTIVKGLRAMSDFEYEFQMAIANRKINAKLDTIFLTTSVEYMYLSSSLVRELGHHGGDISGLVPEAIRAQVFEKLYHK